MDLSLDHGFPARIIVPALPGVHCTKWVRSIDFRRRLMRRFTDSYGARPAHLLVLLACFAVAAYAGSLLLGDPALLTMLVWFVGAALAHDLVLFPLLRRWPIGRSVRPCAASRTLRSPSSTTSGCRCSVPA